ncbi:hypothetical protein MKO06_02200 [Gramella sp. GC03-9]|uniref:Phosphate-selective porin O/P n=1 Tax=Christiangramia oceanisediminis TaxID=2920386 RepID=A0A9X2KV05_9FLAO|nr:hypothetical protein [Gramella oceanisediminis]MCP9198702.1 hypothetical protein [Gramella oceanisediminis]
MKTTIKYFALAIIAMLTLPTVAQNQRDLDNFRYRDQRGINQFEAPKDTVSTFDGLHVRIGGASTIQFQDLDQENSGAVELNDLEGNFNLATANLDLDVALYDGVRMHLRTYLSSQHHNEAYVKGGYIQIDKLDFIRKGFAEGLMDHMRVKIGHMENNYGDAHFRRTDNAMALYNPFIGNYLMDSFTTEVGAEVYYFGGPWLAMVGFTNGKLNQSTIEVDTELSWLAKFGYDNQITDNFRLRLTGSVFASPQRQYGSRGSTQYLYAGDRAGTRYYNVMEGSFRAGRINPDFGEELTSFMFNPFIKYGGLEFFGIIEVATGGSVDAIPEKEDITWNHYAAELIYRFGTDDDIFVGARYNTANDDDVSVNRFNLGAGWFLTKNILLKGEYVNQEYNDYPTGNLFEDAQFNGVMLEAVISF